MKIRTSTPRDLDAIVDVFLACWNISYVDLLPPQVRIDMTPEVARKMWQGAVEVHPDRHTLVVDIDGHLVGVARIGIDPNDGVSGHLFSLYIHPDFSGRGIGRALVLEAMNQLSEIGLLRRTLWVFKGNVHAQYLYSSIGFRPTGAEKIDSRWQIPEIEMELNLEL